MRMVNCAMATLASLVLVCVTAELSENVTWVEAEPEIIGQIAHLGRHSHTAVMDSEDQMWGFGGDYLGRDENDERLPSKSDLFVLQVNTSGTSSWEHVNPLSNDNFPPNLHGHSAVMDPTKRLMWVYGGAHFNGFGRNVLYRLDLSANPPKWWRMIQGGPTSQYHSAVMDSANRMWVFGGLRQEGWLEQQPHNELHCFDGDTWHKEVQYRAENADSLRRSGHSAIMDSNDCMWVFGGQVGNVPGDVSNDLYRLCDLKSLDVKALRPEWKEITATDGPSPRVHHTAALDCEDRMWIYGGKGSRQAAPDDLYYLDLDNGQWIKPTVVGAAPQHRFQHSAVMDSKSNMWIFGGTSNGMLAYKDTFILNTGSTCGAAALPAAEANEAPAKAASWSQTTTVAAEPEDAADADDFTSYVKFMGCVLFAGSLLGLFFYRKFQQRGQHVVHQASTQCEMAAVEPSSEYAVGGNTG